MKRMILSLSFFVLFAAVKLSADVVVYLDPGYGPGGKDIQLTLENLMDPGFPRPKNHLPVLFVHGHNFGKGKNFRKNWQQSFNGLPSFRETLELAENSRLGIEPYYIDLEDYAGAAEMKNRSIREDAAKIKEAVELILLHQDDPAAKVKKVVIIAYSRGTISARCFLEDLWKKQNKKLSFHPVSEFIAISPPNHGLNSAGNFIQTIGRDSLALKQLNNGRGFIEKLNGHPMRDTMMNNYCGQVFDAEAPGSRRNNEPVEKGILYVTLYAAGNRDIVGGSGPSHDCRGRVLAKNLAPDAENREVTGIPGGSDKIAVHQNTVHMPEVICKALYTAFHHQAPPDGLVFERVDENNRMSPPIVPDMQAPRQETGIVLLFDISASMSHLPAPAKRAVEPFIQLLGDYGKGKAAAGMAVFPALPWSFQKECGSQVVYPMTLAEKGKGHAVKTVKCLKPQGNTPLLGGIDTALQMFGSESRRVVILLSDGNHNCPAPINANTDDAVKNRIKALDEKQAAVYAVGTGSPLEVDHNLLRKLAEDRTEHLQGKFIQVMKPGISLTETYMSIFTELLKLQEVTGSMGTINAGETITAVVKVNGHDRKISFLLNWLTPGKGRLGLTIKAPDGEKIAIADGSEDIRLHEGETWTIITVHEHFLKRPGNVGQTPWKAAVHAPGLEDGARENYRLSVIADSPLKMKTGFDKTAYETGDTITLSAAVTEGGRPVTGLTAVFVKVTRPGEGLGNWYAANKVSAGELETVPGAIGADRISRLRRKAIFLTRKRGVRFPKSIGPLILRLYDDGSRGDKKKGDGIYTNRFKDTIKQGTYSFRFQAADAAGTFEREKNLQMYVAVKPGPQHSRVSIQWRDMLQDDPVRYLYHVELVPKDRYGNFAGPGRKVEAKIVYKQGDGGGSTRLLDNLDGTYSGEVGILKTGPGTGVQMVFFIDGKTFTTVEKIPGFKRWSLGIYTGIGIPGFSFARGYNPSINLGCNIGYRLSPQFSLVGLLGYNRFKVGAPLTGDTDTDTQWWNISGNLKSEIVKNPFRVYVNAGPGIYISGTGALKRGFNLGAGGAYSLTAGSVFQLGVDFHQIYTRGLNPSFFVTYARLVYFF